jgi:hypothetical protein
MADEVERIWHELVFVVCCTDATCLEGGVQPQCKFSGLVVVDVMVVLGFYTA